MFQRVLRVTCWASATLVACCLAWFLGLSNDWTLWQNGGALQSLSHPTGTMRLGMARKVGLLAGNGNHCDFFSGEVRSFAGTHLSAHQIRAFYGKQAVWHFVAQKQERTSVATIENGALTGDLDWDDRENFLQRQFGAK